MAGVQLVLCNPLCFFVNKFSKHPVKLLKTVLLDFYSPEDISTAKLQLLEDIGNEKVKSIKFPHIPQQRYGENRTQHDVDDIVTLLTVLDEKGALSDLPTYVADDPDKMPSVRLYEGDFKVFTTLLEKLGGRMDLLQSAINSMAHDLYTVRTKVSQSESGIHQQPQSSLLQGQIQPRSIVINKQASIDTAAVSARQEMTLGNPESTTSTGKTTESRTGISTTTSASLQSRPSWASLMSTPVHDNRFNLLTTTEDDEPGDGDGPFIEPRAARVKRQRQLSALQKQQDIQAQVAALQQRRLKAPLLIGRSTSTSCSVGAAKKIF